MDERRARVAQAVRDVGADWAVLTSPDAVCYATGHAVPIETGPSPFAGGPTTALIGRDGSAALIAANVEAPDPASVNICERYIGYAFDAAADRHANYLAAVDRVAAGLAVGGTLAVETASFPAALRDRLAAARCVDITAELGRARAVKTGDEIARLRRAAQAAATGQRAAFRAARAGISELALFAEIRGAIEAFAGARVPLAGDLISGQERTAGIGGWPSGRIIATDDPLIADLAPRVDGYWGDSCASFTVGTPSAAYVRMFQAARGALTLATEIMRPGLPIAELDRQLRAHMARQGYAYPHHSGHSIGTAVHEFPRLVPYETTCLAPDMVLMVEPGAYDPAIGGVRTEWMLRVTGDGCEPMAPFDLVCSSLPDWHG